VPGVAPVAILEGRYVAKLIRHEIEHGETSLVNARRGNLFITGIKAAWLRLGAAAVAQFGKIHISGFLAWLAWLFVHIFFLIGFQTIAGFYSWAWSYFTYERGRADHGQYQASGGDD